MSRIEPTPAKPALQSSREAGQAAQQYVMISRKLARINVAEKAAIEKAKTRAAKRRAALEPERLALLERLQTWAEVHRQGRKTIKLPNGRQLKWRKPSSSKLLVLGKIETIARLILRFPNWRDFLEVTLKKNEIKTHLDELHTVPGLCKGLQLDTTEYFSIS